MNIPVGFIAALVGLGVSIYITYQKNKKAPLMCPRRSDCTSVVTGKHSVILGVPNDVLGILYYGAFSIIFGLLLSGHTMSLLLVKLIAGIGVLFTVYLVGIQAFVIRKWCMWCLVSAVAAVVVYFAL